MRRIRKLLFGLLLACSPACSEAPWLNPVDAPERSDEAIAVSIQAIENHVKIELDFDVVIHWLDQECINFSADHTCDTGFHFSSYWYPECEIWVIRGESFADTSLAHELMHCSLLEETDSADAGHTSPWWQNMKAINAEVREWEEAE